MVTDIDSEARAIFDRARLMLNPEACRETIAVEKAAQPRVHRDDGYSCDWAASMLKAEPERPSSHHGKTGQNLTNSETARWQAYVSEQIADAINRHAELHREVLGAALAHERKLHRAEVERLDLRLSALLAEVIKKQAVADGGVVKLPMLPLRSQHHG